MKPGRKVRVTVVDDHPVVRQGLGDTLEANDRITMVSEYGCAQSAVEEIDRRRTDIVLMDIEMKPVDGIAATRRLLGRCPRLKVIAVSEHDCRSNVLAMVRAGACGFVTKRGVEREIAAAVLRVHEEGSYFSRGPAQILLDHYIEARSEVSPKNGVWLSDRQQEVVQLLSDGYSTKEIASALGTSVRTIDNLRTAAAERLSAKSPIELIRLAGNQGLVNGTLGYDMGESESPVPAPPPPTAARVLIVDDDELVRRVIGRRLTTEPGLELAGTASDGGAVLEAVDECSPDLVLMDLTMPGTNGIEATKELTDKIPSLSVLALTGHVDKAVAAAAIRAGATGLMSKGGDAELLFDGMRKAALGQSFFSSEQREVVLDDYVEQIQAGFDETTRSPSRREMRIIALVAAGRTTAEIAERLKLGVGTVGNLRIVIRRNLGLKSPGDFIRYADAHGLSLARSRLWSAG